MPLKKLKNDKQLTKGGRYKMFTQENTEGYNDEQLEKFNKELEEKLLGIEDPDEIDFITKSFSDEVARRNY